MGVGAAESAVRALPVEKRSACRRCPDLRRAPAFARHEHEHAARYATAQPPPARPHDGDRTPRGTLRPSGAGAGPVDAGQVGQTLLSRTEAFPCTLRPTRAVMQLRRTGELHEHDRSHPRALGRAEDRDDAGAEPPFSKRRCAASSVFGCVGQTFRRRTSRAAECATVSGGVGTCRSGPRSSGGEPEGPTRSRRPSPDRGCGRPGRREAPVPPRSAPEGGPGAGRSSTPSGPSAS